MLYNHPYTTAEQIFGRGMTADELILGVRTCDWKEALIRIALLGGLVANSSEGARSETVKQRTVDQVPKLTGPPNTSTLFARGRAYVATNRDQITLAHDEVLSFLQHLILLEGADAGDVPGDPEIALWMAGANGHLDRWIDSTEGREALMAEVTRILRFNNQPDAMAELVRTRLIFGTRPPQGEFSDEAKWRALEEEAFGSDFFAFFESLLGPLYLLSFGWGVDGSAEPRPRFHLQKFVNETKVSRDELKKFLAPMVASRDELRAQIQKKLRPDGLPHAPTALLQRPLVEIAPEVFVAATPWALRGQMRTGVWWRYLSAAKKLDAKRGADAWFSTFGYMVEYWCRRVAEQARSGARDARVLLPSKPGAPDEVEDVVVIESGCAIMFSVKSRLVDARAGRDAISPSLTIGWFEDFFFEQRGDDYRGGAVRMLDGRIKMVRTGAFENLGVTANIRIYPVIVTYDNLGEHDMLYRWIEERCRHHNLLQQPNVGPLAFVRVSEFEQLMSRLGEGRSIAEVFRAREGDGSHRRLDQLIHEGGLPRRLPFFEEEYGRLTRAIHARLSGASAPAGTSESSQPAQ
jgi:hypothetical protein